MFDIFHRDESRGLERSGGRRGRRPRRLLIGLTLAGVAATVATPALASVDQAEADNPLRLEPCHVKRLSELALCGTLEVPEDHDDPAGRSLRLRVAVLPALARPAAPDPVFLLAGGPGQSAVAIAAGAKTTLGPANRLRDIVLVDQRGTGESSPLDCDLDFNLLAFDDQAKASAVTECLASLEVDPANFGTLDHVRDLEAVRGALGAERVHLYGGSYGTRVAQVYLREFPESLATVTMDAVASMEIRVGLQMGADAQLALEVLFTRCEQDEACATRFPDFRQRFADLLAELERNPRDLRLPAPVNGQMESVRMDHRLFGLGLRPLLYGPQTQRLVPLLIEQASQDDWVGFTGVSGLFTANLEQMMTVGLMLAVLCTEDLAGLGDADIPQKERDSFVGTAQIDEFLGYCAAWPVPDEAFDFTPVTAPEVPVLLLSGALDPATPPYLAEQVAQKLPRSRHLVVEAGGHTVGSLGCVPDLVGQFIESGDAEALDPSCLADISFPSFFVSSLGPTP